MADLTRIQFKRSKTPNVRPAPDTVAEGEIILNLADRAILTKLGNEIIDLGFAKGGKVDGNIDLNGNFDQKNGHFNTTGNVTVGGTTTTKALSVGGLKYSGIDIRQDTNKYIRLENTADGSADFAILWKRDADGSNLSSFKFPAGHGIGATQEWVNKMVQTSNPSAPETIVRNPSGTNRLCLVVKDNGTAGAYDFANERWAFLHNQAGFKVFGSGEFQSSGDYASVILKKSDKRYVQIETSPHAGSPIMLNFIYRQADGTNQHVMQLPYENGVIASREWVNVWLRNGSANTETILSARENSGESFMFLRSNDHNIGFSLQGSTKFRITPTAITTESGLRTFAINGTDNSTSNRPQIILDSKADLWRMEPDGAGKLQLTHPASGALYEFEKDGGTQQVASKQWVSNSNQSYNQNMNLKAGNGSSSPISVRNWGSGDRKTVFEVGDNGSYFFYAERKGNNNIEFNVNGSIVSGGQPVATQQWVNSQGFQKGSSNKQWSRGLRTLSGIGSNTWGTSTRGIQFAENLNNRIVVLDDAINGSAVLMGSNIRTRLINSYTKDLWAWIDGDYIKYSWEAGTNRPADVKVTIMEFY